MSGLGVDSLEQLREIGLATYDFPDMHMIGDILVKLGFTNPVMDMDKITLEYDNLDLLLKDVRILGIGAAAETRNAPLKRHQYAGLQAQFTHKVHADKFPLTLEVLYAHAWKDNEQLELPAGHKSIKFFPKK